MQKRNIIDRTMGLLAMPLVLSTKYVVFKYFDYLLRGMTLFSDASVFIKTAKKTDGSERNSGKLSSM